MNKLIVILSILSLPGYGEEGKTKIPVSQVKRTEGISKENSQGREVYTNSIGMRFLRIPDSNVWVCEHETRVRDFAAFVKETGYRGGSKPVESPDIWLNIELFGQKQNPDHPVVKVSWNDAREFLSWLGEKETQKYRLPTDHEWSTIAGIGPKENPADSPHVKNGDAFKNVKPILWDEVGIVKMNLFGAETRRTFLPDSEEKGGEDHDPFPFTAPVKSFPENKNGFYDLAGNVWEWCSDNYYKDNTVDPDEPRVMRGGSWGSSGTIRIDVNTRIFNIPNGRFYNAGFRAVLDDPK